MPDVHPIAQAGFSTAAERYESGRPGYPAEAVSWMIDRLGIERDSDVLDVAAGTGKFTRLLHAAGLHVTAIEPITEMAGVLRRITPDVPVVAASAQHLPVRDAAVDAITVAQAMHWFDNEATWTEFARVVRPGGGVGLIWNARDRSVAWVDRIWSIMDAVEKRAPWRDHDRPAMFEFGAVASSFEAVESARFGHEAVVTREAMLDRVASVSHVSTLPEPRRRAVLDEVWAALPAHDQLRVPYRVDVFVVRRT